MCTTFGFGFAVWAVGLVVAAAFGCVWVGIIYVSGFLSVQGLLQIGCFCCLVLWGVCF